MNLKPAFLSALFCTALLHANAWAACTNPDGVEGEVVYNASHKVMQFSDGAKWWGMGWNHSPARAVGTAGQIQFSDGNASLASENALFWDSGSKKLGIGTNTPERVLDVIGSTITGHSLASFSSTDSHNHVVINAPANFHPILSFSNEGVSKWRWSNISNQDDTLTLRNAVNPTSATVLRVLQNGNVSIGNIATPTEKLHVAGNIRATDGLISPNAPRAWVAFNGTNGNILSGYNVSSITRHEAGRWTVNFTTPMPNTHYATQITCANQSSGAGAWVAVNGTKTINGVPISNWDRSGSPRLDCPEVYVTVFAN